MRGGRDPYDALTVARSGHTGRRRRAIAARDGAPSSASASKPPTAIASQSITAETRSGAADAVLLAAERLLQQEVWYVGFSPPDLRALASALLGACDARLA